MEMATLLAKVLASNPDIREALADVDKVKSEETVRYMDGSEMTTMTGTNVVDQGLTTKVAEESSKGNGKLLEELRDETAARMIEVMITNGVGQAARQAARSSTKHDFKDSTKTLGRASNKQLKRSAKNLELTLKGRARKGSPFYASGDAFNTTMSIKFEVKGGRKNRSLTMEKLIGMMEALDHQDNSAAAIGRLSTITICCVSSNSPVGTGILASLDGGQVCLITAAHVAFMLATKEFRLEWESNRPVFRRSVSPYDRDLYLPDEYFLHGKKDVGIFVIKSNTLCWTKHPLVRHQVARDPKIGTTLSGFSRSGSLNGAVITSTDGRLAIDVPSDVRFSGCPMFDEEGRLAAFVHGASANRNHRGGQACCTRMYCDQLLGMCFSFVSPKFHCTLSVLGGAPDAVLDSPDSPLKRFGREASDFVTSATRAARKIGLPTTVDLHDRSFHNLTKELLLAIEIDRIGHPVGPVIITESTQIRTCRCPF